jgi:hypothetical protein
MEKLERMLAQWIEHQHQCAIPLSTKIIQPKAKILKITFSTLLMRLSHLITLCTVEWLYGKDVGECCYSLLHSFSHKVSHRLTCNCRKEVT